MNNLKTGILLTLLTVLLVFAGGALAGQQGAVFAFGLAILMNGFAYFYSDKLVLRRYRAAEVTEAEAPELYGVVANLAQRAQIPMPRVYVIPSPALNAFATGRNPKHAAVAVTEGLLKVLDRSELAGVLAHELSHVKHRDILIGTVAATVAGAVTLVSSMARWGAIFGGYSGDSEGRGGNILVVFLVSTLAALGAMLVQMAISRSREFEADKGAARLTGDPSGLIGALRKLEIGAQRIAMGGDPATAHMFIVNPLRGGGVTKLFSTHPPTDERIQRLQGMIGLHNLT
jgi:heat shock protein HtpX